MRANSSKQRVTALCILRLELLCSCRVGGWSGHLTASGSRYDFPGVDHEGRQTCRFSRDISYIANSSGHLVPLLRNK